LPSIKKVSIPKTTVFETSQTSKKESSYRVDHFSLLGIL